MKKVSLLLLMLLTLWLPWARAQQTLTVCDGTATSNYVPVYGFYNDGPTKDQFIIESDLLENIGIGGVISQLQFYSSDGSTLIGHYDIYLSETTYSQFQTSNFIDITSATNVCSLESLTFSSGIMTIPFTTNYTYNGGNLLVTFNHGTAGSNCPKISFTGNTSSVYASIYGTNYGGSSVPTSGSQTKFQPKTTITFTPGQVASCPKPTNFSVNNNSVTHNSATINWNAGNASQNNFIVAYGTGTDPDDASMTTLPVSNATSATLNSLTPLTTYHAFVKADCGGGDVSDWCNTMVTFTTTAQATVVDVAHPLREDFEGTPSFTLINGSQANQWVIGSGTNNGGSNALYISNNNTYSYYNGTTTSVYATKLLGLVADTYHITFDWQCNGESTYDYLRVFLAPGNTQLSAGSQSGISSSGAPTGWIAIDGGTKLNQKNGWQNYSIDLPIASAGNYLLVFHWHNDSSGGSNPPAAIDNLNIAIPSCKTPYDVDAVANSITTNSATITWTPGDSSQNNFVVVYGTGTTPTDASMLTVNPNPTTNQANLTSLAANTEYHVFVKAICSASDESDWSNMGTFRTECDYLTIPYQFGFEASEGVIPGSNGFIPCWNTLRPGSDSYPYVFSTTAAHTGDQCLYFYQSSYYPNTYEIAVLPELNTQNNPINTLRLKFYAKKSNDYACGLKIGVMTDPNDASTFTEVETVQTNQDYTEHIVSFANYNGTGAYIAFNLPALSNTNNLYIDDITLELLPSCLEPSDVYATSTSTNSATITWTKGTNTQNNFQVVYGTGTTPTDPSMLTLNPNPTTNQADLSNLAANTEYHVFVKAICSASDESGWSNMGTFRTECDYLTIPFQFGFEASEGVTAGSGNNTFIPCWTLLRQSSSSYPYVYSTSSSYQGYQCLYFYQSTSYNNYTYEIAALPELNTQVNPINTLRLRFYAKKSYNYEGDLKIGVMTDPTDASTFTVVETVPTNLNYTEHIVSFANYNGTGAYIAINFPAISSNYNGIYVDNITLELLPTCLEPSNLTGSHLSDNSITLSWTSQANSFELRYKEIGASDWTTITENVSNPFLLDQLDGRTSYVCQVRGNCGDAQDPDFSEWSNQYSFTTLCGSMNLPYTENFDSYTGSGVVTSNTPPSSYPNCTFPECWTITNLSPSTSGYPQAFITSYGGYNVSGKALYFKASNTENAYVVLPTFTEDLSNLMLDFYYRNEGTSTSSPQVTVGYTNDPTDENAFVAVTTYDRVTTMTSARAIFPANLNADYHIAFRIGGGSSNNYYASLDNIYVSLAPTCFEPTNLTVSNVTDNSARLNWTPANESQVLFEVAYGSGTNGNDSENMRYVNADAVPFTLTELTAETSYNVFVRANCGDAQDPDYSEWSSMASFTTTKAPIVVDVTHPFSEDFEGATQSFDLINGTLTNKWAHGTAAHNGENSEKALYVSNDNGTSNAYTITSNTTIYAAQLFSFDAGNYEFSYDWKANGESISDYLRVALVPTNETLTAGTTVPSGFSASTLPQGWIALDGGSKLNLSTTWATKSEEITLANAAYYYLVFVWRNNSYSGNQAPAAIDNISITAITCGKPSGLTAYNATDSSVTLQWTPANESQQDFVVAYGPGNDPDDSENMRYAEAHANPFVLTPLAEATTYNVFVKADCGNDDYSSWSDGYTFHTLCSTASTALFSENFDDLATDGTLPGCWEMGWINKGSSTAVTPFVVSTSYKHGSTGKAMSLRDQAAGTISYLSTQCLPIDAAGKYMLSVWVYRMDASYYSREGLKFWASPSLSDTTNATLLGYVPRNYSSAPAETAAGWYNYEYVIPTSGNLYILVEGISQYGSATFFDDMEVKLAPSCLKPSDVIATNVTPTSVTLSWTAGSLDQENFVIAYGTGTDPNTMTTVPVSSNPATLDGVLTPGTTYNVFVKADCGNDDYSEWHSETPYKFTTAYGVPFYEDFEASNEMPASWTKQSGLLSDVYDGTASMTSGSSWYIKTEQQGLSANHMYNNVWGSSRKDWAITPNIYLDDETQLTFDLALTAYSGSGAATMTGTDDKFAVLVSTDNGAHWTQANTLALWDNAGSSRVYNDIATNGESVTLSLAAYTGQTVKIAFYVESTVSNADNNLHVDNIAIEVPGYCAPPTNVTASGVTSTRANISWTAGSASEFVVRYTDNTTMVTTTLAQHFTSRNCTLTGLNANTQYSVEVKAICGEESQSNWSTPYQFTTATASTYGPIINPVFFEDFENATIGDNAPASPHTWMANVNNYYDEDYYSYYDAYWDKYDATDLEFYFGVEPHGGDYCASQYDAYGPIYLISPEITITESSSVLSFWDFNKYASDYISGENSVLISTTGYNIADFTTVLWSATTAEEAWREEIVPIPSEYLNTPIHIAFKYEGEWSHYWIVDDITIGAPTAANLFNVADGNWNDASKWSKGTVPTASEYVVISNNVTIPANCIATAENVTLDNGGSITIADGGQLVHGNADLAVTLQKNVAAYTGDNDHFYLVASPSLVQLDPAAVGMYDDIEDAGYDLYSFQQFYDDEVNDPNEWRNYRVDNFNLKKEEGYLYANDAATTLSFTGTVMPATEYETYVYNYEGYAEVINCAGFNLVGNPFVCNAAIDGADGYYKLNANGEVVIDNNPVLAPGEAVFTYTEDIYNDITFTNANANRSNAHREGIYSIELVSNNQLIDRAIASTEECNSVPKMTLKKDASVIYFSENGRKMGKTSVAGSDAKSLNLEVVADGNYTLRLSTEHLSCSYLHLIDNLTGADIDLLRDREYNFSASANDSAARFQLVFKK